MNLESRKGHFALFFRRAYIYSRGCAKWKGVREILGVGWGVWVICIQNGRAGGGGLLND